MDAPIHSPKDSRAARRFVPTVSLAASLLDKDLHVVHGMVANLSDVGASLLTCRGVDDGSYVAIKLSRQDLGVVETLARVVWTWGGESPGHIETTGSGLLVGVSFCGLSAAERERIWTCSPVPPRAPGEPRRVPFRFDQLSEPEVDWFLAREVDAREVMAPRPTAQRSSSPIPPLRPWSRRSRAPA